MFALLLGAPTPALAQSAQDTTETPAPPPDDSGGVLREAPTAGVEEIVITGEVLESTTQAEPEAITTFDQEELDTLGIASVDSLALNTPSLHVGQVGQQAVITLRGVGLENLTSVGEAGVGFEVDGVHLGRPSSANAVFFDLERIDVLRGPQGHNGGRNLTAGRIALHSKKPTEDFEAFGDVTIGNYDHYQTRLVLNLPFWQDKLMTRTSVLLDRRDGYQDNIFDPVSGQGALRKKSANADDSRDMAIRVQGRSLWLDQTLELRAIGTYGAQDGNGPALKLIGPPPTFLEDTVGAYESRATALQNAGVPRGINSSDFVVPDCPQVAPNGFAREACVPKSPRKTASEFVPDRDNRQRGLTGHLTYDVPYLADTAFSDLRLKLIGSWYHLKTRDFSDLDGTNIPDSALDQKRSAKQTQVEGYIERADVGKWDFKGGFFYFREDIDSNVCFDSRGLAQFADLAFQGDIETESWAGYGHIGFRPFDNLRIFGAVRYTDEEKSATQFVEGFRTFRASSGGATRDWLYSEDTTFTTSGDPLSEGVPPNTTFVVPKGQVLLRVPTAAGDSPETVDPDIAYQQLFFENVNGVTENATVPGILGDSNAARAGCGEYFRNQANFPTLRGLASAGIDPNDQNGWLVLNPNNDSTVDVTENFSAWTPHFGLEWQVNETSTLGFTATRGFKAGGFPLAVTSQLNEEFQRSYDSEKVWNFEITSKNQLFDGLMRLNGTLFWTEYDPFQICQIITPIFFCRSDGSATIRGVELEWFDAGAFPLFLSWATGKLGAEGVSSWFANLQGLEINGHFNYLDSRINNFQLIDPTERTCDELLEGREDCLSRPPTQLPLAPQIPLPDDVSGNQLPKAPEYAGSFGIQYTGDLGRFGYLTPRFQLQYQGRTYFRVFNLKQFSQEPFVKFDLRLSWRSENDRFFGEFFVVNLTNEDVINSTIVGSRATGGQVLGQYQPPRLFGMKVGVNYISDLVEDFF